MICNDQTVYEYVLLDCGTQRRIVAKMYNDIKYIRNYCILSTVFCFSNDGCVSDVGMNSTNVLLLLQDIGVGITLLRARLGVLASQVPNALLQSNICVFPYDL